MYDGHYSITSYAFGWREQSNRDVRVGIPGKQTLTQSEVKRKISIGVFLRLLCKQDSFSYNDRDLLWRARIGARIASLCFAGVLLPNLEEGAAYAEYKNFCKSVTDLQRVRLSARKPSAALTIFSRGLSSIGRAPGLHPGGWESESPRLHWEIVVDIFQHEHSNSLRLCLQNNQSNKRQNLRWTKEVVDRQVLERIFGKRETH